MTMPRRAALKEHSIDWLGAGVLAGGTAALLLGLVWAGRDYAWTSGHVLVALGAAVVLLAAFAVVERRAREPILPFDSLRNPIVATALPTIAGDLHGLSHLSWVVTAYLLASTVSTPLWGKLGDMYGRKRFFQASIVIFLVGSALCGLAQGMTELVLFRAIQGIGAGGLFPLSLAVIGAIVPPRDRGRYQGLIGAVFAASSIAGPAVGGFIVDNTTWRWIFLVNLPVGGLALAVSR